MVHDSILQTMIAAARSGGAEVAKHFRRELTVTTKSSASDVVTQADLASEQAILQVLRAQFPLASFQSEEAGIRESQTDSEWFVIDPLDGTHNFSLGLPTCSVSIARMQPKGTLTHGVIYEPIIGATFAASIGGGAWHIETGQQLRVSQRTTLDNAVISYCCSYQIAQQGHDRIYAMLSDLHETSERVMTNWSPAMDCTLVARGMSDAVVSDTNELHDVAAGLVLIREAGGVLVDFQGKPAQDTERSVIAAATPTLAQQIADTIQYAARR